MLVLLDGEPLPPDVAASVAGVRVREELSRPARFELRLRDAGRASGGRRLLEPGREIEIRLGHVSKVECVLRAEIGGWQVEWSAERGSRLTVSGHDRLHRLTRTRRVRSFVEHRDSDIARALAREHDLSADVDDSGVVHPYVLQDGASDADFLLERAAACGFLVRVDGRTLVFRRPDESQPPAVRLTWGVNLGRLSHEVNTFDQRPRVEARSWDPMRKQVLTADASTDERGRFGAASQYVLGTGASLEALRTLGRAEMDRRGAALVRVEGRGAGVPSLRAGRVVEICKAGRRIDGTYFVTQVEHVFFVDGGYETAFEARLVSLDRDDA